MTFARITTVFRKELADVLRDRRTLIATIVIPVVLYPLLMLLSLQAVTIQTVTVAAERIIVGVPDETTHQALLALLADEQRAIERRGANPADADDPPPPTPLIDQVNIVVVEDLRAAVLERRIQVGVALTRQVEARLVFQAEEIRSQSAAARVQSMLRRVERVRVDDRLAALDIDRRTIEPVVLRETRVSTPGSLLSLIVPTLLVLMTVTSAIYPAIDLTAGEHERGTLESLLVTPVPVLDLVVGKFLAVATIGLLGATLNLGSVAATAYFGGLGELLRVGVDDSGGDGGGFPWMALPIVLLALVPFSVLMAAILIAVAGCARSFKEAQNYMTPVMIAVLLPAMVASLPGARLDGLMLVLPVGNIVLLVRELLGGAPVPATALAMVLLSTCAYAAAAVAIAAQTFGRETVMFADSVSLRAMLSRAVARPRRYPSLTLVALYTAVLFPVWFYLQTLLQQISAGDLPSMLRHTGVFMPLLFAVLPMAMLWYWKIDLPATLALQVPGGRHVVAGALFGLVMWVPAHEIFVIQQAVLPMPEAMAEMNEPFVDAVRSQPIWLMLLLLAVVPAVSEELFFRGFLQSGLATTARKWTALLIVAAVFALFHFYVFRFGTTFLLGLALGWLCWQSRSIWPAILAHAMHNGQAVMSTRYPQIAETLGVSGEAVSHLPLPVMVTGAAVLAGAVALAWRPRAERGA